MTEKKARKSKLEQELAEEHAQVKTVVVEAATTNSGGSEGNFTVEASAIVLGSKSGRTTLTVKVLADGSGLIHLSRDGSTMHRFDIPYEQAGVDGPPKHG